MKATGPRWLTFVLAGLGAIAAPQSSEESLEVVASHGGFRPNVLNLRKGETARVALKTADDEHCFAVDEFRIEKRIMPGKTTTLDLTPPRVGTFPFYSCLEPDNKTMRGRLVVVE